MFSGAATLGSFPRKVNPQAIHSQILRAFSALLRVQPARHAPMPVKNLQFARRRP
ncbi:MAG: hypothetical protein RLZZ282_687 [Verrucomicrobiota bacterium]|jgi:hypothetical protein